MNMNVTAFISLFYLALFFLMQSFFIEDKKIRYTKNNTITMCILFFFALVLRISMANIMIGYGPDMSCWRGWAGRAATEGLHNFYAPDYFCDYPPFYIMVLSVLGKIQQWLNLGYDSPVFIALIKLPAMLADVGLAAFMYFQGRKTLGNKTASALSFLFLISPMMILNSTFWGQIDALFSLAIIASFYFLYKDKFYWAAFLYTISFLMKPQAFIVAPVYICAYFIKPGVVIGSFKNIPALLKKIDWKTIGISVLIGLGTVLVVVLPFTKGFDFSWLIDKYAGTLSSYPYASLNAFNIYTLFGYNWKELSSIFLFLPVSVWSNIAILVTVAGSVWFYVKAKDKDKIFFMGYLIIATMFMFGGKMHERYLYPALICLAFAYIYRKDKRLLYVLIGQSVAHFVNIAETLVHFNNGNTPISEGVVFFISAVSIALYVYSIMLMFKIYIPGHAQKEKKAIPFIKEVFTPGKMVKKDYIIMAVITLVYAVVAFVNLGDMQAPQTFYFTKANDEIQLDLGKSKYIGSIMLYLGIGDSDNEYTVQVSRDGSRWMDYATDTHSPVFAWKRLENNNDMFARYIKISSVKENMMLGEIGIMDLNNNPIPFTSDVTEITDEQDVIPEMPSYMNGTYFDEIYHPRTAYEITHEMAPYETTHPPLGKLFIAIGIKLFGMTPFGWRCMGTLAGILMLPVMYLFIKKLLDNTALAGIGTFIFAFDFMHFTQTRLATIDSYGVLFIMLTFYFMIDYLALDFNSAPLKKGLIPLALTGVIFGIGCASKWICIYSAMGILAILLVVWIRGYRDHVAKRGRTDFVKKFWKTIAWCVLFFVIIPLLIYGASYIPQISYDLHGRTPLGYIIQNQEYMFNYHKGVTDSHPYSSKWYEWFFMKKPLWAHINGELRDQGIVSSISTFGNPAVWWAGFFAMLLCVYFGLKKKSYRVLLIIIPYLTQLLPWVFVTRVVFIYHYFACVPFLVLAIVYVMYVLKERYNVTNKVFYGYCGVVLLLFIMFYPVISGMPVSKDYITTFLKWFEGWVFVN